MTNNTDNVASNTPLYSIIVGVFSLMIPIIGFFVAIGGIVLSAIAMKKTFGTKHSGKGLAITGLSCSIVTILAHIVFALFFLIIILLAASEPSSSTYYY